MPRLTERVTNMKNTVKKPTKAEIARKAAKAAMDRAAKNALRYDLVASRLRYAKGEQDTAELRNTYAFNLNRKWASTMQGGGHHWTVIADSKNAKHPDNNLYPIWKEIEDERLTFVAAVESGPRGHTNSAQVWKRFKERAYAMDFPNQKRAPRISDKLPIDKAKEKLVAAYYAVAKETVQSEADMKLVDLLGKVIIQVGLDLRKINEKIG